MDFVPPLVLLLLLLLLLRVLTSILAPRSENLPPGPPSLRIITNILSLRSSPHQTLAKLSNIYGPLMHLKVGTITTIIASSPDLAKQVLGKHDHLLSGRFTQIISRYGRHHELSIVLLPPSNRWRALRRICKEQMISMMQARDIRQDKLNKMRDYVQECCDCGRVLDVSDAAFVTLQNVLSETMFSKDLGELMEEDSGREFKMSLQGLLQVSGTANVADYLPFLEGIDPQGLYAPTMILLMGMKINFTKNPTKPITTKPIAVRVATLVNSLRSGLWQRLTRRTLSLAKSLSGSKTESKASIASSSLCN